MSAKILPLYRPIRTVFNWSETRLQLLQRLQFMAAQEIKSLEEQPPHQGTAIIVGGAPSTAEYLGELRELAKDPANSIFSVNNTHDYLIKRGIIPNSHVIFEHDSDDIIELLGGKPHKDVNYYICTCVSPIIVKDLEDYKRFLWHFFYDAPEYQRTINRFFPNAFMIGGSFQTLFRTLMVALVLGYRKFELFGCDSSFEGDSDHVEGYLKANTHAETRVAVHHPIRGDSREFRTNDVLVYQVNEFLRFCLANQSGIKLRVHGPSLLHCIHEAHYPEQYAGMEYARSNRLN